jgi:peroxiredoxin
MDCIQTELPSVQWVIHASFASEQLTVAAINQTSSVSWLDDYAKFNGIFYPFVFDGQGKMHKDYEVGPGYTTDPPTYIIIDQQGIVRYRTDGKPALNKAEEMRNFIQGLISGGG